MRPLLLEVEGFLSYRDRVDVELEHLHAAAILGPNGAGKTSLIEAMGWALYGRGRFRGPDEFVSVGATECRVQLTFEIGGMTYRVDRQRRRGVTSRSELGLFVPTDFGWQPVGGATIAETQAAIVDVVGLDYDAWEQTSYIAQGKADAFTQLTPAKRKELLGELLDLERYEHLATAAKERERGSIATGVANSQRINQLQATVAGEDAARQHLADAERIRGEAESKVGMATLDVEGAQRRYDTARAAATDVEQARARLAELTARREKEIPALNQEAQRAEQLLVDHDRAISHAEGALAKLQLSEQLLPALEQELGDLRFAVADTRHRSDSAQQRRATHSEAAIAAEVESGATLAEQQVIHERIAVLTKTHDPTCFACGQDLAQDVRDALVADLMEQQRGLARALRSAQETAETERRAAGAIARQIEAAGAKAAELERSASEVEQRIALAHRDVDHIGPESEQLDRARLQRENLSADVDRRQQATLELAQELNSALAKAQEELDAGAEAEHALAETAAHLVDARGRLEHAQSEWYRAGVEIGSATQVLSQIAEARQELDAASARQLEVQTLSERWHQITEMFGRDGIPALIVENAVPEIEAHANAWLERLAKGRLTVRIDSLRAKKTGGLKETLDITVADAQDERPLEGFSGGERQRVNLALRLALAELLASRAGRRIETLILDEAFTALDAEGRQLAIEVIRALEDTFPLTLFVTHLPDMAEQFPERLVVERDGGSSQVEVQVA